MGRLAARDPVVLAERVEKLGPRIWWAIRSYADDDDHADDLLQDCWKTILERIHQYRGRGTFDNWAIAVSKNVCRMRFREVRRKREIALEDATSVLDDAPDPEEELMLRVRREVLHRALDELPDRERDAVIMRMIQGRDTAEIAEAMDVSRSVARSLVARGIARLCRMEQIRQLVMDWMY